MLDAIARNRFPTLFPTLVDHEKLRWIGLHRRKLSAMTIMLRPLERALHENDFAAGVPQIAGNAGGNEPGNVCGIQRFFRLATGLQTSICRNMPVSTAPGAIV
jgi:hypothetical protein